MNDMKHLYDRLAYVYDQRPDLEGEKGQMGLVKASGASKSVVNQWLSGDIKTMALTYALKLESNLGFSHIWLIANLGDPMAKEGQRIVIEPPAEPEPLLTLATRREMELLDVFRKCTDESQDAVFRLAGAAKKRPAAKIRRGDA